MASELNKIASADIMDEGLLISFDDGRCALYPTQLLLSIFSQAREITPDEEDGPVDKK